MSADANEIKAFPSCVVLYRRVHVTWMAHEEEVFVRQAFRRSFEKSVGNAVHRLQLLRLGITSFSLDSFGAITLRPGMSIGHIRASLRAAIADSVGDSIP